MSWISMNQSSELNIWIISISPCASLVSRNVEREKQIKQLYRPEGTSVQPCTHLKTKSTLFMVYVKLRETCRARTFSFYQWVSTLSFSWEPVDTHAPLICQGASFFLVFGFAFLASDMFWHDMILVSCSVPCAVTKNPSEFATCPFESVSLFLIHPQYLLLFKNPLLLMVQKSQTTTQHGSKTL